MRASEYRRGDWLLLILTLVAVLTLPWNLDAAGWAPQSYRLDIPALWAVVAGVLLAWSPLPHWLAWLVGAIFGAEFTLQFVAGIFPKAVLIWRDIRALVEWLRVALIYGSPGPFTPFSSSATHVASQLEDLSARLSTWYQAVQAGQMTRDTTFLRLALTYLVWILAFHAVLELLRTRRAFTALLPLGVALVSNVAYTGIGVGYVYLYFAMALLIMVRAHLNDREILWKKRGVDLSPDLRSSATSTGMWLSLLIVIAAILAPYITVDRAVDYFWQVYGPRFEEAYDRLDRAFAGRNPVPTPTRRPGGPGEHIVYNPPQPGQAPLFMVTTSDPAPVYYPGYMEDPWMREPELIEVPKRYWRERTYDVYTSRGWDNSTEELSEWAANTSWKEVPAVEEDSLLTQTYVMLERSSALALSVNEPLTLDQLYAAITRGSEDLVALQVDNDAYTAISLPPQASREQLQAAGEDYPEWVRERYLPLDNIPERVQELAQQVVQEAGAETPYDKARAIEAYLRQFEYDLEIEPPPPGADLVEYFIFDLGKGYCDYTASAMVVMLRSVGVPARYASGYNMGVYDEIRGAWVVRESNAHAWPEVYFPGLGWIEFEPTPSQAVFDWPAANQTVEPLQVPPPPPREGSQAGEGLPSLPARWGITAAIVLVIVLLVLRPPTRLRRSTRAPAQLVTISYQNLIRLASWLGLGPRGGQTPLEYLDSLAQELLRRGANSPTLSQDLALIGHVYQRVCYSNKPPNRDEAEAAERAYRRLRPILLRLLFSRRPVPAQAS